METCFQTLLWILFTKESNLHSRTPSLRVILLLDSSLNVAMLKETYKTRIKHLNFTHSHREAFLMHSHGDTQGFNAKKKRANPSTHHTIWRTFTTLTHTRTHTHSHTWITTDEQGWLRNNLEILFFFVLLESVTPILAMTYILESFRIYLMVFQVLGIYSLNQCNFKIITEN